MVFSSVNSSHWESIEFNQSYDYLSITSEIPYLGL